MNNPLGIFQYYDKENNTTHLEWSYVDDSELTHFEIEVYDQNLRKWVKTDGPMELSKSNRKWVATINK